MTAFSEKVATEAEDALDLNDRNRELGRVRLIRDIILFIVVAVGLGIGSSYLAINNADKLAVFKVGPWHAWPDASSPKANPYSKADQARRGSLMLGSAEGIAFVAETDDEGTPLDGGCQYRITGSELPARIWTVTLANMNGTLVENPSERFGYHSQNVARINGSEFEIVTGPDVSGGDWLKSEANKPFKLIFRLYETPHASGDGYSEIRLPQIAWMSCQ
ncbi:DUF1214 domain-containing protein [uncultured Cohaesibacter sp.]|uniref:DUF1214 domain-containing protein n=1 Tax=uncultured Cohaesibacter sp. TaxID=1002546 RepID=UPI00292FBE88|nr:DUF1214 domain-containing protein [uncultured Cohaesibacter sp.]